MTQRVIFHAGTGTVISLDDSVYIIDVPDECKTLEEIEDFCNQDLVVITVRIDMPYCSGTLKPKEIDNGSLGQGGSSEPQ